MALRVCFLDDYGDLVGSLAPTDRLEDVEWRAVREHLTGDDLVRALQGCDVAVAMRERTAFDRALLSALGDLRLLCTTGAGNAAIDLQAAADLGVTVCGTGGPATNNTAELAWGLILSVLRRLPEETGNVVAGRWQTTVGRDLSGATLGLVGLGRIGSTMARIGRAFDMDVIAWSENLTAERAESLGVTAVTKAALFATADVVSVHLVLSDRTRGLIGDGELRAMKPTAVLINTSRGPIVDEAALLAVLGEGRIAGAGLDVFDTEPLPADHPLRTAPGVVATPHIGYATRRTLTAWFADVVEDITAWQRGAPVRVLTPAEPVWRAPR